MVAAPLVVVEREDDGAFVLSLNRPDKLNALSIELREAAAAELRGLAGDKDCRGLVLTGPGKAFCAGMDFSQFGGGRENRQRLYDVTTGFFDSLLDFPKPLIGAVQGAAVGGGFTLALVCDELIATEDAFFGFYEVRRGLPAPLDIVRCFVDQARAADWCDSGRRVGVAEAVEAGIVSRVVAPSELLPAARETVRARNGQRRETKAAVRAAFADLHAAFHRGLFPDD